MTLDSGKQGIKVPAGYVDFRFFAAAFFAITGLLAALFARGFLQCIHAARALGCSFPQRGQTVGFGTAAPESWALPDRKASPLASPPNLPASLTLISELFFIHHMLTR